MTAAASKDSRSGSSSSSNGGGRGTSAASSGLPLPPASSVVQGATHHWQPTKLDREALSASPLRPRGTDRAVARLNHRLGELVYNDAALEGNTHTLPEVRSLLEGVSVSGHTVFERDQLLDGRKAAMALMADVEAGTFRVDAAHTRYYHGLYTASEVMEPGIIRGLGATNVSYAGAVNVMGDTYYAPPDDAIPALHAALLMRVGQEADPVLAALTYAVEAPHLQVHPDGNKRTARAVMNGILMSHGFDAIVVPAVRLAEFHSSLAPLFREGDGTPHAQFLLTCWDDELS